jgi:molybdenum cofactor cytidylyltransferase
MNLTDVEATLMITAILLAAGESRRMGKLKQVLPLGDKTLVEHCIDNLLASRADDVIVVTGHRESEVRAAIGKRRIRIVRNDDYERGMASSIKCAVKEVSDSAQACIISLVDQPRIDPATINSLIDAYTGGAALIVIPTFEGKGGHPILFDRSLRQEILDMDDKIGLRQVVQAHRDSTMRVEVCNSAVLEDCDLPEDYERISEL